MKYYWGLILIAISMAFGTGYYALFLQGSYIATPKDIRLIRDYKQDFLDNYRPLSSLKLGNYYPYVAQQSLIKPPMGLRASSKNSQIYSSNQHCFTTLPQVFNFGNFKKTLVWEEFRCGARSKLPPQFFTTPPYMHPSGKSFMYLAHKLKPSIFSKWNWLHSRLYFFHVEELFELSSQWKQFKSTPLSQILALGLDNIYKISARKSPLVIENKLFLKKNQTLFLNDAVTYDVFSLSALKESLSKTEFTVKPITKGAQCFYKNEDLCWSYNFRYLFSVASKGSLLFFIFSVLVIVFALWMLYQKLKAQKLEDDRRRLALQVLSHEFRTPVASLLLTTESLMNELDHMSDQGQIDLMRASSDIHRLHRLVELSRQYLKIDQGKRLVDLKRTHHESTHQLVRNLLNRYEEKIQILTLNQDSSICIDDYWLGICLKNLVENSLKHGQGQVVVSIKISDQSIIIIVKDEGQIDSHINIEYLTQEFIKGPQSEGSGLGLNIVLKIVKEMKGNLSLEHSPTTFSLKIPRLHKKYKETKEIK